MDGLSITHVERRATQAGVILGTAAYMSPEQAKGKPADRRADIWSFGVVLFEMLSGRRLFSGETVSDTLAAVLRQEIDWKVLPVSTPPSVRRLLERCLERDPKQRLQAIGEARIAWRGSGGARRRGRPRALRRSGDGLCLGPPRQCARSRRGAERSGRPGAPLRGPRRCDVSAELGADASLFTDFGTAVTLSPDGAILAFVATKSDGGPRQLYVRGLDELRATALSGTEDAVQPFFAPMDSGSPSSPTAS